jgi:hypothetical protein
MRLATTVTTLALALSLAPLTGQTPAPPVAPPAQPSEITLTLSQEGGRRIALAVPPATAPASDIVQSELVDPFHKTLAGDLGISPWFVWPTPPAEGFRPPTTPGRATPDRLAPSSSWTPDSFGGRTSSSRRSLT